MKNFRYGLASSLAAAVALCANAARAEDYDSRFYIAPMGSYVLAAKDRGTKDGYGGVLAVGKPLLRGLDLEVLGTYLHYPAGSAAASGDLLGGVTCGLLGVGCPQQPPETNAYGGGVGVNFFPFPFFGVDHVTGLFAHADVMAGKGTLYDAGLGYDLPFSGMALRVEALYHRNAGFSEAQFNLGLRIPLGSLPPPAAEPAQPVQVVPVAEPPPPPPPPCQPPAPGQPANLEGCKTGDTIVLHGVNFEFNKATLTVNAKALLDQVADALLAQSKIKVEIDGHTDGKGGDAYNQKLSENRAASVKDYLASRGVDSARMSAKGFGKSMPVADNATEEGRELNRRVELKVTDSGTTAQVETAPAPP